MSWRNSATTLSSCGTMKSDWRAERSIGSNVVSCRFTPMRSIPMHRLIFSLLTYCAKTFVGKDRDAFKKPTEKLPLEIVPVEEAVLRVLWQGKPLAGAEVVLIVPGQNKSVELKSADDGTFRLEKPAGKGLYG